MSPSPEAIRALVARIPEEIRGCGKTARNIDPKRGFSYPAMCGGLQSVVRALVQDLAGADAAEEVEQAFRDVFGSGT